MLKSINKNFPTLSWSKFGWQTLKDLIALVILLLLSFYVVYFMSPTISKFFFLLLVFLFFVFRKDYFWFAFFFIITQGPGYFFADFAGTSLQRLPLYTFLPGMSFTPIDLFVLFAFLKALTMGKKMKLQLEKPLLLLLIYIIFVVSVNSFIYRTSADILAWNLRWLFYYSIIISFVYLVNKKQEVYKFITLVFPFVFFILFTQIYFVATGNEFINLFNPGFRGVALNTVTGELRPLMGGELILLFSFLFSIFLLVDKKYDFSKLYLYLVLVLAFFSIFLSATRLWFVIFSFIFGGYILVSKKKISSAIGMVAIFFLVLSVLMYSGLISSNLLIESSWGRLHQVIAIARGDVYSVDTAMNRLVNQLPIIAGIIKQNPLIGFGFSNISMNHYDNDFGFLNTILMFGIIGFSLFIVFFIKMFLMLISSIKNINVGNRFRLPLKIMVIAWLGVMIGYFSTWDFFTMDFGKVFFISLLVAIGEFFAKQANKEELLAKQMMWPLNIVCNKRR